MIYDIMADVGSPTDGRLRVPTPPAPERTAPDSAWPYPPRAHTLPSCAGRRDPESPARPAGRRCASALKRQDFPVLDFLAGRQPHLVGAKKAPRRKNATRRINRWRLGVYSTAAGSPKWKFRLKANAGGKSMFHIIWYILIGLRSEEHTSELQSRQYLV